MTTCFDVAKYILRQQDKTNNEALITTWKLQKLVYYSQAWATVWDDEPIFKNDIEAWANGPVVRALYNFHKRKFKISYNDMTKGNTKNIKKEHKDTIDEIIKFYGKQTPQYLSELTHRERPWIEARKGLKMGERGNEVITLASMAEFYGSLYEDEDVKN